MANNDGVKMPCRNCSDGILIFDVYAERVNNKIVLYRISGDAVCDKCGRREIITGVSTTVAYIKRKGEVLAK